MSLLVASGIRLIREGRTLLRDVSLTVSAGELHVLLGPNGAGKSTLLRALSGEWPLAAGGITLDGSPLHHLNALQQARRRAVLPQHDALAFGFSVRELVRLGRYAARDRRPSTEEPLLHAVLQACDLAALADRSYSSLSGGERRRAQLARVVMQVWDVPKAILLLDEPVSSLDPAQQHSLLFLLRALAARGFGILASVHDIHLAASYAQRISLLREGELLANGPANQVLDAESLNKLYGESLQFSTIDHDGRRLWFSHGRVLPFEPRTTPAVSGAIEVHGL